MQNIPRIIQISEILAIYHIQNNEKNLIIIKAITAENAIWKRVVHSKHLWKRCLMLLWAQSLLPGDCSYFFMLERIVLQAKYN